MKKVLIELIKKYKWIILIHTIFIACNIYMLTIPASIIGNIVDLLYDFENNKQAILNNTYYLLGICIILMFVRIVWKKTEVTINRKIERDLINDFFARLLKLKVKDIEKIKNGEIMSYFVKDINEIRSAIYRISSHGERLFFTFIFAIMQMAKNVNINLTIAVILPILIGTYLVFVIKKYVEMSFRKSQALFTEMSEFVQENTDGIRTIKAYSYERDQLKEFIRKNKKVQESDITVDLFSNLLELSVNICFGICYAISLIYGSHLVINNVITVGDLVAFNGYIALFVGPITWLQHVIARCQRAKISFNRLDKIYQLSTEKIDEKNNIITERLEGNISIRNLDFNYPDVMEKAVENINIELKKGQTLGIIGTIGSGKTTLMNLLVKLYSVPNGKIFIDGKDINEIPIDVLRNNICYITQENFLFSTTLKNNISLFRENYKDEEITESTKRAIVYDDIQQMSNGVDTVIGERGADLSGGQKQRLSISRAFLKDSSILIFDDTFSALDNRTSQKLINNIKNLAQEKTCIIISNKVSDVKNSDEIIVLDNGKIVERGKHEDLLNNNYIYSQFYKNQSSKAKPSILA